MLDVFAPNWLLRHMKNHLHVKIFDQLKSRNVDLVTKAIAIKIKIFRPSFTPDLSIYYIYDTHPIYEYDCNFQMTQYLYKL